MEIHTILVFSSKTQPDILEDIMPNIDILYCCKIFVNDMIWWLFSKTKYDDIFIRGKKLIFSDDYKQIGIDLPKDTNFMSEFIDALYGRNNRRWLYFVGLLFFIVFVFFIYWYRKQIIHFLKRLFKMRTDN